VSDAVSEYLHGVDDAARGFVEALYITGSVALGDYRSSVSDVDLVAVCRSRPADDEFAALAELHRPSRPSVDVVYATREDLRRDPSGLTLPGSVAGEFRREGAFDANPVVWRVLSTRSIAVRGADLTDGDVWFDADSLRDWNLGNLEGYWSEWVQRARAADATEARVRHEYGLQWLLLGVPRLHYTIATLEVTSKTGAGRYALGVAPAQWHTVLDTAAALRADRAAPLPAPPDELWRDAIDCAAWFIADAQRLGAARS
jgi:predicted nucleotidyltransferase